MLRVPQPADTLFRVIVPRSEEIMSYFFTRGSIGYPYFNIPETHKVNFLFKGLPVVVQMLLLVHLFSVNYDQHPPDIILFCLVMSCLLVMSCWLT